MFGLTRMRIDENTGTTITTDYLTCETPGELASWIITDIHNNSRTPAVLGWSLIPLVDTEETLFTITDTKWFVEYIVAPCVAAIVDELVTHYRDVHR